MREQRDAARAVREEKELKFRADEVEINKTNAAAATVAAQAALLTAQTQAAAQASNAKLQQSLIELLSNKL